MLFKHLSILMGAIAFWTQIDFVIMESSSADQITSLPTGVVTSVAKGNSNVNSVAPIQETGQTNHEPIHLTSVKDEPSTMGDHPTDYVSDSNEETGSQQTTTATGKASEGFETITPSVKEDTVTTDVSSGISKSDDTRSVTSSGTGDHQTETSVWPDQREIEEQQKMVCSLGCDCTQETQTDSFLDCSGRKINELPDGLMLFHSLAGVSFEKNGLKKISSTNFIDGPNVTFLDLAENKIEAIEENSFQCFQSLNKLRLSNNRLRSLTTNFLSGLEELRELDIGHNEISEISGSFFAPVKNLQEVKMQNNRLEVLDENVFEFLYNLEKLDLGGNGLKSLHPNLFQFTPLLNWLSLTDNAFEDVPRAALSKSKKLASLDLSRNRFQVLRRGSFKYLNSVTILYLNNIQSLERIEGFTFANMTNLKFLYCSYNRRLHYIHPDAFGCPDEYPSHLNPTIDHLYLRQNALEHLPEPAHVGTWSRLSYADFRENPWICDCNLRWMKKVPQEVFSTVRCESPLNMHGRSFPSLQETDLECNDSWMLSTIILGLTSCLVFVVCLGFAVAMIYSRSSIRHYIRSRTQFSYSKVPPKTEVVDLEWDPSADL